MAKTLVATKGILDGLVSWGKVSNLSHSDKIRAVSFFFINGKDPKFKERILVGDFLVNLHMDPAAALLTEVFQTLTNLRDTLITSAENNPSIKIVSDTVEFFQIYEKDDVNESGQKKRRFWCNTMGPFNGEGVQMMFADVINNAQRNLGNKEAPEVHDTQNLIDFESLSYYGGDKKFPVNYLISRITIKRNIEQDTGTPDGLKTILSTQTLWHLMGIDHSRCVDNYLIMDAFGILPVDSDLGKVEELK